MILLLLLFGRECWLKSSNIFFYIVNIQGNKAVCCHQPWRVCRGGKEHISSSRIHSRMYIYTHIHKHI